MAKHMRPDLLLDPRRFRLAACQQLTCQRRQLFADQDAEKADQRNDRRRR
jgi:hypothetical protein